MDTIPYVNFALSINNKDQLRDLYNYLNHRLITAINNLDDSTLGDTLIQANKCKFQLKLLKMTKRPWRGEHLAGVK